MEVSSARQSLHCEFTSTIYKNFVFRVSIGDYRSAEREQTSLHHLLAHITRFYDQPVYLCGEVEGDDERMVSVPLVCKENWEEFIKGAPDVGFTLRLEVKKLMIVGNSWALFDCWKLAQCTNQIDELDIWGKLMDYNDTKHICNKIFYSGYTIKNKVKATLWKNILGIYHPSLTTQEQREVYYNKLRQVYEILKKKWCDRRNERRIRRLCDTVKRDADRTDISEEFYRDPSNQNTRKLINIVVTYVEEHPNISYTQGMTDMLSPILYVMDNEADAYICFSCLLQPIQENFTAQCEGVIRKIQALKHLCEVLAPDLYYYLERLDQDTFTLCFGMLLIECRREFSFQGSINLLEAIIASRFGHRITTQSVSEVFWANYMTTASLDILQEVIPSDDRSSTTAHSINGDYRGSSLSGQSPDVVVSSSSYHSNQPKEAAGYHVIRSHSTTPQFTGSRRSFEHSTTEPRATVGSTPVPYESGLDSSTEGSALRHYPHHNHYLSSPDDRTTPTSLRFHDNPQDALLSSGRSSRASSVPTGGRLEESLAVQVPDPRETTFALSFPLFICLAVLLSYRRRILHEQVDFIGISGLLNDHLGNLQLQHCLNRARQLKQHYHFLQQERFGYNNDSFSKWLVEDIKRTP